ncbi:hypothetical protein BJ166DRAFT_492851 [Pestalotiopsis sp. NC0098]|nr:hypothetical protein BJ166DRAFT_492851 [Pestalotiopsis sp. NC0098]
MYSRPCVVLRKEGLVAIEDWGSQAPATTTATAAAEEAAAAAPAGHVPEQTWDGRAAVLANVLHEWVALPHRKLAGARRAYTNGLQTLQDMRLLTSVQKAFTNGLQQLHELRICLDVPESKWDERAAVLANVLREWVALPHRKLSGGGWSNGLGRLSEMRRKAAENFRSRPRPLDQPSPSPSPAAAPAAALALAPAPAPAPVASASASAAVQTMHPFFARRRARSPSPPAPARAPAGGSDDDDVKLVSWKRYKHRMHYDMGMGYGTWDKNGAIEPFRSPSPPAPARALDRARAPAGGSDDDEPKILAWKSIKKN